MSPDELDGCELPFDDEMTDEEVDLFVLYAGADTPAKRKRLEAKWKALFGDA